MLWLSEKEEEEALGDTGELPEDHCHGHKDIALPVNRHPSLQGKNPHKNMLLL